MLILDHNLSHQFLLIKNKLKMIMRDWYKVYLKLLNYFKQISIYEMKLRSFQEEMKLKIMKFTQ